MNIKKLWKKYYPYFYDIWYYLFMILAVGIAMLFIL